MGLSLRASLEMCPEMRLELLLETKQELKLQLLQYIPEFEDMITFEEDEDISLLEESFPFLMLHELCHPLESRGQIIIPKLKMSQESMKQIDGNSYLRDSIFPQARELGIDRGAILVGQAACGFLEDELARSNVALIERALAYMFESHEHDILPGYSFVARLDTELRIYQKKDLGRLEDRINFLKRTIEENIKHDIPDSLDLYESVVKAYMPIYEGTKIEE